MKLNALQAFNKITNVRVDTRVFTDTGYKLESGTIVIDEDYKKAKETILKLVKKETPKTPRINGIAVYCPVCYQLQGLKDKVGKKKVSLYCYNCGQKMEF